MLGESYEPRPEQIQMASAVTKAMHTGERLLAEAGTGVGKSYAYLLPAIQRCVAHGETVVIATNTIALQEQIVRKDLPMLMKALDLGEISGDVHQEHDPMAALRPAIVIGRGNYLSLRRLELASKRQDKLFVDASARDSLHIIEDWARDTRDGTRSTIPQLQRPGVWDNVRSDSGNCMGRRCPNHDICFYQRSRRKMERSNLLICNHALFFSDLALRSRGVGFLPRYDHVVLDEAHMIEDVASEHFGVTLTEGRTGHLLRQLFVEKGLKGFLPQLQLNSSETQHVQRAVAAVVDARDASGAFFESVVFWHDQHRGAGGRVRSKAFVDNIISPIFSQLATRLRLLKDMCEHEADKFELHSYAERASDIADAAHVIIEHTLDGCAYWVEVNRSTGFRTPSVKLQCSPIEVATILRDELFKRDIDEEHSPLPRSVVLTSATLTTHRVAKDEPVQRKETAFAHLIDRLGCDNAKVLQVGSPFDHATQTQLIVDTTMPLPQNFGMGSMTSKGATYHAELARRVLTHIEHTDGGAFVLFTSFAALYAVADEISMDLKEQGIPIFVQGRGASRSEMLAAFKEDPRSVLLGAASFWQGVDVRGQGLRNVIITRLPFDPPGRPLTEARLERIKEKGQDPFRQESIPRAVIRFKQGFGRLIRSKTDTGRVVVLDPRIVTTGYGRHFLAALPEGVRIQKIDGRKPITQPPAPTTPPEPHQRPEHKAFDENDLPF